MLMMITIDKDYEKSDATQLDNVDKYDEEFDGMRFHSVAKNYERVSDHCHYTGKYNMPCMMYLRFKL